MPISSNIRKAGPYTGTGLVTTYPFYFKVFQAADLYVVQADTADVETVLVLNTDYTVSLNADQDVSPGGNVVLTTALASGYALVITSSIENLQPTDLTNMGGFYPSVITDALDRACIQIQQIGESIDRSIKVPLTTPTGVDIQLPAPSADKVLGWNSTGTAMRNYSPSDLATSVAYGNTAIDKFTGNGSQTVFTLSSNPASQNNLYISVGGVVQNPDVDYVWTSGTTLTFTTAPPNGTVVLVRYMIALAQVDIPDAAITTTRIADAAVTTGKIADSNVTNAKIADAAVTTIKIADQNITLAKLARVGTAGKVLTSNGTGADPSYQAIPAPSIPTASDTTAGIIELATAAEVQAGTDTSRAIVPSSLAATVIGMSQTWQDVTASRIIGTTYTNSTGKPIMIAISLGINAGQSFTFTIGGTTVRSVVSGGAAWFDGGMFIVPNGVTYSATGTASKNQWAELR